MMASVGLKISRAGLPVRVVGLAFGENVIGRSLTCDVVLPDHGVSRRHFRLVVKPGVVMIEDLASGNGTFIDGDTLTQPQVLTEGMVVTVGLFSLALAPSETTSTKLYRVWLEEAGIGMVKKSHLLGMEGATIGRSVSRNVMLDDPSVSRAHCQIVLRQGSWWLLDNASANGITHNEEPVTSVCLKNGDMIGVGSVLLKFCCDEVLDNQPTVIVRHQVVAGKLSESETQHWPEPTVNEPKKHRLTKLLLWGVITSIVLLAVAMIVAVWQTNG